MEHWKIVPIEERHAEGFHACLDFVAREKKFLVFQEAPPIETTRSFVRENVETGQVQWVVLDRDKVVGWCDILRPKLATFSHVGVVGLGLLPEYRGQGIGRALLETTLEAAMARGMERIELTVYESNRNAIGLYRSLGFIEEGRLVDKARIDGVYHTLVCMALFAKARRIATSHAI